MTSKHEKPERLTEKDLSLKAVPNGRSHAVMAMDEISEEKRAKEALFSSEERYRLLVEQINDALIVIQDEAVKFVNTKALAFFGYSEKDIFSKSIFDLIHPEDRAAVLKRYHQKIKGDPSPTRTALPCETRMVMFVAILASHGM